MNAECIGFEFILHIKHVQNKHDLTTSISPVDITFDDVNFKWSVMNIVKSDFYNANAFIKLIYLLLFIALAITVYYRIFYALAPVSNIGGIEPNVIYTLQKVLAGYHLYENPAVAPFPITQYSPMYYKIVVAFGKLFSINPNEPAQVFLLSRFSSLFFNMLYVSMVFLIARDI